MMEEDIIKPQIIQDFEQLQKENEELQQSVAELKDKNLRQLAEMDNIRKNALKQRQDYMKYTNFFQYSQRIVLSP